MSVGVIVPVYGTAPYLYDALESVLSQEPPPEDVIVVDDGSPQPVTLDRRHARACQLVRRDRQGGPGLARDTALALLATELIACADADDVWLPGKLAAQRRALEHHPEVGLCFGAAVIVGPDGTPTGERWEMLPTGVLPPQVLAPLLFERNPIPTSSVVVRRQALRSAGGFTGPPLGEDWALWLRLLSRGEHFLFEPQAGIRYRRHPDGVTADIAALAESAFFIHETHGELVDEATRRRVKAADLTALARGRIRQRRYRAARSALTQAARLARPGPRELALQAVLAVPLLRAVLGRRDPYRRS
ncbi:MAG TPA: glycosyltransferase family 2 protein [Solirubrobacteraceae bacterium]|nr:glycosyltransferase family 2 protein [Solirubrobacteraceae bacterium]